MAKKKGKAKQKGIPAEVQQQAEEVIAKFNKEISGNGRIQIRGPFQRELFVSGPDRLRKNRPHLPIEIHGGF